MRVFTSSWVVADGSFAFAIDIIIANDSLSADRLTPLQAELKAAQDKINQDKENISNTDDKKVDTAETDAIETDAIEL